MSAVGNTYLTLPDLASRWEDGDVAKGIVEIMDEMNEGYQYIPWVECNDGDTHLTTVRTGIPDGTWRKLNYGVVQSKSTTAQVRDSVGMLENYSTVDMALVKKAKNKSALLLSESKPIMQGMVEQFWSNFFYGNEAINSERFTGLAARFNALTGVESAENVLDGEGSASANTSVWLVVFGDQSVHGLYPSGSKAGLDMRDLGEQTVYDGSNNPYQANRSHFKFDPGLSVRDWRQVVRIANIDVDDLTKDATAGSADLIDLMIQATEQVHNMNAGKAVFMCNRKVRSFLRRQIVNRSNLLLSLDEIAGKKVLTFDGIPVCRQDAILNTEAALT